MIDLKSLIDFVSLMVVVLGAFAVGRTIYVYVKEPIARNVDCCVHLPLLLWAILHQIIALGLLAFSNAVVTPITGSYDVCSLFDSQTEVRGLYLFLNVFLRASFIPCVLITIYMPYLALTRSEFLGGISHMDILKSAGVGTVYSTILGLSSIIYHNEYGLHTWVDKYCSIQPEVSLFLNVLSILLAFTFGPYFWFYGLKEYFNIYKLTDQERTVAFGQVMDTLRLIREKENQIMTQHEIEMLGVTTPPSISEMNLSPHVICSSGSMSGSPSFVEEWALPNTSALSHPTSEPTKRKKYVSDIEVRSTNLTKPPLHRIITADSPGHVMMKKANASRKSLLSRKDLQKRKQLQSKRRMHSIFVLREQLLDDKDIENLARERDLENITPKIIRVVNALNKKLIRCCALLGFVLVATVIATILELTETSSITLLQFFQLISYFAPLLVCNIVFEATSFKNAEIRLIPYNNKLRQCISECCFSPFRTSKVDITIVPRQQPV